MRIGHAALTLAGALAILAAAPVSAATVKTVSSGNLHLAIKDRKATTSVIRVRTAGAIKDVNVLVRLDHAADGDLDLYLSRRKARSSSFPPTTVAVAPTTGPATTTARARPRFFDDEAAIRIFDASAPFAGTFSPEQRLAGLDRSSRKGTWRLIVGDNSPGAQGTLFCWKLKITV